MRLSTKSRFAVTALIDVALREDQGPVSLAAISAPNPVAFAVRPLAALASGASSTSMRNNKTIIFCLISNPVCAWLLPSADATRAISAGISD